MAATITFYNTFKEYCADGTFDLNTDSFKVALVLSGYTFSAAHTVYADISASEHLNANGYTTGGASLGSVTWGQSGGTATFDAADTQWTASGGSISARRAVIYKDGTANSRVKPLVASVLLEAVGPADVTATTGNTFTLQWNGSGIFTFA